jgi:hypothetical protein
MHIFLNRSYNQLFLFGHISVFVSESDYDTEIETLPNLNSFPVMNEGCPVSSYVMRCSHYNV